MFSKDQDRYKINNRKLSFYQCSTFCALDKFEFNKNTE